MVYDNFGSGNVKVAVPKSEVPISQLVDMIEAKSQRLTAISLFSGSSYPIGLVELMLPEIGYPR